MSANGDRVEAIRAAGGLLWRETADCQELAIVHRKRYGGDWTLPKGKVKQGESWQEAALREVAEETGYEARLGGFAGATIYPVEGVPKIVLFWNMVAEGRCAFVPSEEVAELKWLRVEEALEKLSYESERAVVAEGQICSREPESSKGSRDQ